jgi:hypothetical protein
MTGKSKISPDVTLKPGSAPKNIPKNTAKVVHKNSEGLPKNSKIAPWIIILFSTHFN